MGRTTKSVETTLQQVLAYLHQAIEVDHFLKEEEVQTVKAVINIFMDNPLAAIKSCRRCGKTKLATTEFFDKDSRNQGGLVHQCKDCRRTYTNKYKKAARYTKKLKSMYSTDERDQLNAMCLSQGRPPIYPED